ncbi:MAG: hypothetical protein H6538_04685 [Bacteroidales bacterium]|nr:hypothetical protein [Bacteroidales bacterium]MCB9013237.1 hypothetical protein [Bacteroidales bacterium]
MNIRLMDSGKNVVLIFTFLVFLFGGCSSDNSKSGKNADTSGLSEDFNSEMDDDLVEKINTAKRIFYSLPSPLETAMLIKSAGASYNGDLLNKVENTSKYNTNLKMALNLGIYTTDLSYASLFDQSQATLSYINAAKKMADGLEILDAIDEATIRRLEENINNRDIIIDIISETLLNSNSFLEDKGLQNTSAMILVGGWVEGLYVATSLIAPGTDLKTNKLVERIVDQKLSINIVQSLLENNKDNPEAQLLMNDISELKKIYDKISIQQSEITPVEDPNTNITTLKSESTIVMSREVFDELTRKVKELRTRYIS